MRRHVLPAIALLAALFGASGGDAGGAAAPRVRLMIVGKSHVLRVATLVPARATTVSVGVRRCAVAARTPLAALLARDRGRVRLRDFGSCGRRAIDSASLFVTSIAGDLNRGQDGWVYKLRHRVPGVGAADPAGTPLRSGERLLWFYCHQGARGCQRTLEIALPSRGVAPGAALAVSVLGYDDRGHAKPVAGATVTLAGRSATTARDGRATLAAPSSPGGYTLRAGKAGLVPAFPVNVNVT